MGYEERARYLWSEWSKRRIKPAMTYIELLNLSRWIHEAFEEIGVDPELVEWEDRVDPALSYYENVSNLASIFRLPPPPYEVAPPKPPRKRKPKRPPEERPAEFRCPLCDRPLEHVPEVSIPQWREVSVREEILLKHPELVGWELEEAVRREEWRRREAGEPLRRHVPVPVRVNIQPYLIYHCANTACPGYCRYYRVVEGKLKEVGAYEELLAYFRRVLRAAGVPTWGPPRPRPMVRRGWFPQVSQAELEERLLREGWTPEGIEWLKRTRRFWPYI